MGKVTVRRLYDEMVVVVHEAIGVAEPMKACGYLIKGVKEELTVVIVLENSFPGIAPRGDVVDSPVILYSQRSRHALQ